MPKMILALRQRERVIERVWSPLQPELLSYNLGGAIYTRTYTHIEVQINKVESGVDPIPFGFHFNPPVLPDLVPIGNVVSLATDPVQQSVALQVIPPIAVVQPIGSLINPDGTPIASAQGGAPGQGITQKLLRILTFVLAVGVKSTPVFANSILVRRVTIKASTANPGIIWIGAIQNQGSGQGFSLPAGAAKDFGEPDVTDKLVDLSSIYVIGTNAVDQVEIAAEV